ncbi:hypothetical protein [Arenibaculum pallidiluteum]|uniref:hypothetical protein n=1 Tax=Arenibaculum pallidiluteum TaxID=2812559 RepID=UPI001A9665E4|nr:hypothetical protein [Arenibaculum pallidiluteum]
MAGILLATTYPYEAGSAGVEVYRTGGYVGCATRHVLKEIRRNPARADAPLPPSCHVTPQGRPAELVDTSKYYPRIRYLGEDGRWTLVWTVRQNLIAAY